MLKRATAAAFTSGFAGTSHPWRMLAGRQSSGVSSVAVNSMIVRSIKEHYAELSKMSPPPKVSPPAPFTVVKGSLDPNNSVLRRTYENEEISLYVMRLASLIPGGGDDGDDGINQLLVHVDVRKPGQKKSLHFLCDLYPDALGIHSVSMLPVGENSGFLVLPKSYVGPNFGDLDEKMRDAFHNFIEERGINESLFPFLQAWLYVKDHRNLTRWFKTLSSAVKVPTAGKDS